MAKCLIAIVFSCAVNLAQPEVARCFVIVLYVKWFLFAGERTVRSWVFSRVSASCVRSLAVRYCLFPSRDAGLCVAWQPCPSAVGSDRVCCLSQTCLFQTLLRSFCLLVCLFVLSQTTPSSAQPAIEAESRLRRLRNVGATNLLKWKSFY